MVYTNAFQRCKGQRDILNQFHFFSIQPQIKKSYKNKDTETEGWMRQAGVISV